MIRIFEYLFTMTLFTGMTPIYDKTESYKLKIHGFKNIFRQRED